jgi:hypothetical protein
MRPPSPTRVKSRAEAGPTTTPESTIFFEPYWGNAKAGERERATAMTGKAGNVTFLAMFPAICIPPAFHFDHLSAWNPHSKFLFSLIRHMWRR